VVLTSIKKNTIDMQLHMTVKTLAIIQGEINCKIDEVIKKATLLQEKGEYANYLVEMISENLDELGELFKQRKNLRIQIENMKRTEIDLMKE
jgi:hypothetical protein